MYVAVYILQKIGGLQHPQQGQTQKRAEERDNSRRHDYPARDKEERVRRAVQSCQSFLYFGATRLHSVSQRCDRSRRLTETTLDEQFLLLLTG